MKLRADDDVVDGDVNKFDKESDEAHDSEPNGGSDGDLLEFWKRNKNRLKVCSTKNSSNKKCLY